MYIQLMYRRYGVHRPIKHIEIPCNFSDIYMGENWINERLLLENIPEGWLPVPHSEILLTVADGNCSIGQLGLEVFKSWAKYFHSYVLELHEKPREWWGE